MTTTPVLFGMAADEDLERERCDNLARACGITRVNLSEKRRSRLEPGLPDAYYRWPSKGATWWWEAKAEKGKLTREQHEFLSAELACNNLACCGTAVDFTSIVQLLSRGLPHFAVLRRCRELVDVWASKGYRVS